MSSVRGNTHWCYQCRQPVCLRVRDMVCPRCEGGFVQELEEFGGDGNSGGYGSNGYRDGHGSDQMMGIMEALDSLMLRSNPEHRYGSMEALDGLMTQRRRHGVDSEPRSNNNNADQIFALVEALEAFESRRRRYGVDSERTSPWLIFQGQMPARAPRSGGGFEMLFNRGSGVGFTRGNIDDFFVGPGLQQVMEQLMSDRQGPPPAPRSEIDGMPTIKITRVHLHTDSHCPVCKDRFELGTDARQMPCNHIYHSDCIVPWLVQHNSCPVCRHVLGSTPTNIGQEPGSVSRSDSSNSRARGSNDPNPGRRNPFSFLWPFRSSGTTTSREYADTGAGGVPTPPSPTPRSPTPPSPTLRSPTPPTTTTHGENHEMNYSGWPFDY